MHLIFGVSQVQVGYVRLDVDCDIFHVNIYVHEMFRRRGLATVMLKKICMAYKGKKLEAVVHSKNMQSLNSFIKVGFSIVSENEDF